MNRLASDRQEQLRKSSTERLRVKLIKSGWDDDQVMEMDRPTLVEAAAEICLADEQASVAAWAPLPAEVRSEISSPKSSALRLRELEIEEKKRRSHTCDTQIPGHALKLDHTQVQRAKLRNGSYDTEHYRNIQ